MLGTIAGDVIGSIYEGDRIKDTGFPLFSRWSRFTDDTVLTIATAQALLTGRPYGDVYHDFGSRYPHAGYGGAFRQWLSRGDRLPYGSFGNGSAMRVGPVGLAMRTIDDVRIARPTGPTRMAEPFPKLPYGRRSPRDSHWRKAPP